MSRISNEGLWATIGAATQGPWSAMGSCVMASGSCDTYSGNVLGTIAYASSLQETDGDGRNWWTGGEPEANARLIALAPQLAVEVLELRGLLSELHAIVLGECPSLLDEDSGGSARLDLDIRAALSPAPVMDAVKQGDAQ